MPPEAEWLNLKYFLEVFIARNFIEDWTANCDGQPTSQQKWPRLIGRIWRGVAIPAKTS
jgi:hypothetical protein